MSLNNSPNPLSEDYTFQSAAITPIINQPTHSFPPTQTDINNNNHIHLSDLSSSNPRLSEAASPSKNSNMRLPSNQDDDCGIINPTTQSSINDMDDGVEGGAVVIKKRGRKTKATQNQTPSAPITNLTNSNLPKVSKPTIQSLKLSKKFNNSLTQLITHIKSVRPGAKPQYFFPSQLQVSDTSIFDVMSLFHTNPLRTETGKSIPPHLQTEVKESRDELAKKLTHLPGQFHYQYGIYRSPIPNVPPKPTQKDYMSNPDPNRQSLSKTFKSQFSAISAKRQLYSNRLIYRSTRTQIGDDVKNSMGNDDGDDQSDKKSEKNVRMDGDDNKDDDIPTMSDINPPDLDAIGGLDQFIDGSLFHASIFDARNILSEKENQFDVQNYDTIFDKFNSTELLPSLSTPLSKTFDNELTSSLPASTVFSFASLFNLTMAASDEPGLEKAIGIAPTLSECLIDHAQSFPFHSALSLEEELSEFVQDENKDLLSKYGFDVTKILNELDIIHDDGSWAEFNDINPADELAEMYDIERPVTSNVRGKKPRLSAATVSTSTTQPTTTPTNTMNDEVSVEDIRNKKTTKKVAKIVEDPLDPTLTKLKKIPLYRELYPNTLSKIKPYQFTTTQRLQNLILWSNSRHFFAETLTKLESGLGRPFTDQEFRQVINIFGQTDGISLPEYQTLKSAHLIPDLKQVLIADSALVKAESAALCQLGFPSWDQSSSSHLFHDFLTESWFPNDLTAVAILYSFLTSQFETDLPFEQAVFCVQFVEFLLYLFDSIFDSHLLYADELYQFTAYRSFWYRHLYERFHSTKLPVTFTPYDTLSPQTLRFIDFLHSQQPFNKSNSAVPLSEGFTGRGNEKNGVDIIDRGEKNIKKLNSGVQFGSNDELVQIGSGIDTNRFQFGQTANRYYQKDIKLLQKYPFLRIGGPQLPQNGEGQTNGVDLSEFVPANSTLTHNLKENIYKIDPNITQRQHDDALAQLRLLKTSVRTPPVSRKSSRLSPRGEKTPRFVAKLVQQIGEYVKKNRPECNLSFVQNVASRVVEKKPKRTKLVQQNQKSVQNVDKTKNHKQSKPYFSKPVHINTALNNPRCVGVNPANPSLLDDIPNNIDQWYAYTMTFSSLSVMTDAYTLKAYGKKLFETQLVNHLEMTAPGMGINHNKRVSSEKNVSNKMTDDVIIVDKNKAMNDDDTTTATTTAATTTTTTSTKSPKHTQNEYIPPNQSLYEELNLDSVVFRPSEHYGFIHLLRLIFILPHLNLPHLIPAEWSQVFAYRILDLSQWLLQQTNLQAAVRKSREEQLFRIRSLYLRLGLQYDLLPQSGTFIYPYQSSRFGLIHLTPEIIEENYAAAIVHHHEIVDSKLASIKAYVDELRAAKYLGSAANASQQVSKLFGLQSLDNKNNNNNNNNTDGKSTNSYILGDLDSNILGNSTERVFEMAKRLPIYAGRNARLSGNLKDEFAAHPFENPWTLETNISIDELLPRIPKNKNANQDESDDGDENDE